MKVHVDRYRRLTLPQTGRIAQVIAEHEAILTAIEAHDPAGAGIAMDHHLERLLDNIYATQSINPEFFDERRLRTTYQTKKRTRPPNKAAPKAAPEMVRGR